MLLCCPVFVELILWGRRACCRCPVFLVFILSFIFHFTLKYFKSPGSVGHPGRAHAAENLLSPHRERGLVGADLVLWGRQRVLPLQRGG